MSRIRRIPGFENFLLRTPFSDLRKAASEDGAVIVTNLSKYRCDALIIMHDHSIQLVNLSDLHLDDAQHRTKEFRHATKSWHDHSISDKDSEQKHLFPILRYLWATVVCPVMDKLGYMDPQLCPRPRVWWCPTGPLTFLPIHAAGPYNRGGPDIMQRIISSYTTTLASLARARSRCRPTNIKMVGIGITKTPYESQLCDLASTSAEVDLVHECALSHNVPMHDVKGEVATVDKVVSLLNDFNFVHFACHGHQNTDGEPSLSWRWPLVAHPHRLSPPGRCRICLPLSLSSCWWVRYAT